MTRTADARLRKKVVFRPAQWLKIKMQYRHNTTSAGAVRVRTNLELEGQSRVG